MKTIINDYRMDRGTNQGLHTCLLSQTVIYEVFVQSFCDSNDDGIGDLPGLTSKLDYLADLGINMLWLMPIHPSPSYHKYDVTDYYSIHPEYGTTQDFKHLLKEAHDRGIRIIIDLVINHCSRLHPWFTSALAPDSHYHDYFIWEDWSLLERESRLYKEKTADSDNIKQWNRLGGQDQAYFSYFWGGMPDLNHDNPEVFDEVVSIAKFWLDMGVDGFRMDAALHIFPRERLGDCHSFWQKFYHAVQAIKPEAFLIGEVWADMEVQVPFALGFDSLFHFDMAYSILETVRKEVETLIAVDDDAYWHVSERNESPIDLYNDSLHLFQKTNRHFKPTLFLSNHDQDRVLSFLKNNKKKALLAAHILLTLPGPIALYYGEEIGMKGKKPDHHIREPFVWNISQKNFWIQAKYSKGRSVSPLHAQLTDPLSYFHNYKKLLFLRKQHPVLAVGDVKEVFLGSEHVLAYKVFTTLDCLIVTHNLAGSSILMDIEKASILYTSNESLNAQGDSLYLLGHGTLISTTIPILKKKTPKTLKR